MLCKRSNTALALAALAAVPMSDAFAFAPPHKLASSAKTSSSLFASCIDENDNVVAEMAKNSVGCVVSFVAGLGVAAQVAFAEPANVAAPPPTVGT